MRGAFAPVPTPLTNGDQFDAAALRRHLQWLAERGLDGALILGTNGEFPSFTLAERLEVARAAAKAGSGLKLLLNVGGCALGEVLQMADVAAEGGYSAVLCPPPWYWRNAPVAGLAEFFRRVLDGSKLPVLLYHIPQVTGIAISDELLDAIGPHRNLAGIKDSTGSETEMARLLPRCKTYFVGNDRLVAACLAQGGHGSITACASIAPALVKSIAVQPQAQEQLNGLRALLETFGLGGAVKAILRNKRFGDYATRPPLVGLAGAKAGELIAAADLIQFDPLPYTM